MTQNVLDDKCICHGNWRAIVAECEGLLDRKYRDKKGNEYTFFGIVHGSDDYYYGMSGQQGMRLLSCVGSIKGFGFELVEDEPIPKIAKKASFT